MATVDDLVVSYVSKHFANGEPALLAGEAFLHFSRPRSMLIRFFTGNSVHADRAFINKDLPKLAALLHYRILDVSSIKELTARWYPELQRPRKEDSAHRALSDIQHSISGRSSSSASTCAELSFAALLTDLTLQSSVTTARTCSRLRSKPAQQQQQCTEVVLLAVRSLRIVRRSLAR
jgi:hypothetical protein